MFLFIIGYQRELHVIIDDSPPPPPPPPPPFLILMGKETSEMKALSLLVLEPSFPQVIYYCSYLLLAIWYYLGLFAQQEWTVIDLLTIQSDLSI